MDHVLHTGQVPFSVLPPNQLSMQSQWKACVHRSIDKWHSGSSLASVSMQILHSVGIGCPSAANRVRACANERASEKRKNSHRAPLRASAPPWPPLSAAS